MHRLIKPRTAAAGDQHLLEEAQETISGVLADQAGVSRRVLS